MGPISLLLLCVGKGLMKDTHNYGIRVLPCVWLATFIYNIKDAPLSAHIIIIIQLMDIYLWIQDKPELSCSTTAHFPLPFVGLAFQPINLYGAS